MHAPRSNALGAIGSAKPIPTGNLALDALGIGQRSAHVDASDGWSERITDEERKGSGGMARARAFLYLDAPRMLSRDMCCWEVRD